jgi:hypothetical protein
MTSRVVGVDKAVLAEILSGSFEERAQRIVEILTDEGDFFSYFTHPATTVSVLGMFEEYAVVATDRGEFRKVFYTLTSPGRLPSLTLLRAEQLAVPVLSEQQLTQHVMESARAAARAQLDGDEATAARILEDIAPFVPCI